MIMASMRNWLHGGELGDAQSSIKSPEAAALDSQTGAPMRLGKSERNGKRVAVVHCKAGKGRSGTISTSYLISEEGWTAEDALARFTARRMRPKFGAGVSIPSQLRWVSYVDRWTKHGKKYVDRPVEIVEIQIWGLRNGVKVDIEGFAGDGKDITVYHTFSKKERLIVEGGVPKEAGIGEMLWDLAGYSATGGGNKAPEGADFADAANPKEGSTSASSDGDSSVKKRSSLIRKGTGLIQKVSAGMGDGIEKAKTKTSTNATTNTIEDGPAPDDLKASDSREPGGLAVILRPSEPIRIPNSDVSISVERRNKTHRSLSLTMVSAVAHVWFNAFFEGQGPEQGGRTNDSGVFSIDWEAMDGIKGSSRKGSRALDSMKVVWRAVDAEGTGEEIVEPAAGEPVPQVAPADWKGTGGKGEKDLGLRKQTDESRDVSRASSMKSVEGSAETRPKNESEGITLDGVKSTGPSGEDLTSDGK